MSTGQFGNRRKSRASSDLVQIVCWGWGDGMDRMEERGTFEDQLFTLSQKYQDEDTV